MKIIITEQQYNKLVSEEDVNEDKVLKFYEKYKTGYFKFKRYSPIYQDEGEFAVIRYVLPEEFSVSLGLKGLYFIKVDTIMFNNIPGGHHTFHKEFLLYKINERFLNHGFWLDESHLNVIGDAVRKKVTSWSPSDD